MGLTAWPRLPGTRGTAVTQVADVENVLATAGSGVPTSILGVND